MADHVPADVLTRLDDMLQRHIADWEQWLISVDDPKDEMPAWLREMLAGHAETVGLLYLIVRIERAGGAGL